MTDDLLIHLSDPRPPALYDADPARRAVDDFFAGAIANPHTRRAYLQAARPFFAWLDAHSVPLTHVTAGVIGRYFDERGWAVPTEKQRLAGLRRLLDHLVTARVLAVNPAASVRRARHSPDEGKTAEVRVEEVRRLLAVIDPGTVLGLRDRAVIGVLNFTGARVGAVAGLRLGDLEHDGTTYLLRFREKNGKRRAVPVRPELEAWLTEYLTTAGLADAPREDRDRPLFRAARRDQGRVVLTDRGLTAEFVRRMIKRRCRAAGLPPRVTPHSFRVKTVTALLQAGHPLEEVQYLVGHADPRTTRLYDRRKKQVTRNLVNGIPV